MKAKFFRLISLTVALTMLLAPFTATVGAASSGYPPPPAADDPVLNVLPGWAQPEPPEPTAKATPPPPKPGEPGRTALGTAEMAATGAAVPPPPGPVVLRNPRVSKPVAPGVFDGDLRDLPTAKMKPGVPREIPHFPLHSGTLGAGKAGTMNLEPELAARPSTGPATPIQPAWVDAPSTDQNWAGMDITTGGASPPDTVGDVGPNHYIQMVNAEYFQIWDKTGTSLAGPTALSSLWSDGSLCQTNGYGDVIVLYDPLADRWLLSQMAFVYLTPPFYECIAISQGPNPVTDGWYIYSFDVTKDGPDPTDDYLNDYPKLGVWPDAYYMSANQFGVTQGGFVAGAWAFNRISMTLGVTTTYQYFTVNQEGGLLPGDLDGPNPPPTGAPNYFVSMMDDAWGVPYDLLRIYEFHVDWTNPASSTLTGPLNLATEPFTADICPATRGRCIPQPGTTVQLESLSDRLMQRLAYRNFGDYETMVVNHTIKTEDSSGIRWYELRKSSDWAIYQQDTFAPDEHYRWMGSVAMDEDGNIGIGYSVSSDSLYPSIRYTGRKASDPLNTTPRREKSIVEGTNSHTNNNRWGDYSAMSVDPVDECTFWYTQEYANATGGWQTRIASFKFPSCGAPHEIFGAVYDANTLRGLPWDEYHTEVVATPAPTGELDYYLPGPGGYYRSGIVTGTYDVTARAYGYQPNTITGVNVNSVVQVDIPLTPVTSYAVEGIVTNANTSYPVRAHLFIAGDPFNPSPPNNQTWSDPLTGYYSLTLSSGVTYTFHVEAVSYNAATRTVGPLTSDATEDFALTPDLVACTAPGYGWATIFYDGFESGILGPSWYTYTTNQGRVRVSTDYPYAGSYSVLLDDSVGGGNFSIAAITLTQDLSAQSNVALDFWWREFGDENDPEDGVFISDDYGANWHRVLSFNDGPQDFRNDVVDIAGEAAANGLTLNDHFGIKFQFYDNYPITSDGYAVDEVLLHTCQVVTDTAILQPDYIYAEGCPCTPQVHELTFINHTGLTDTVLITYTTSPSVTVLEIPADLGAVPDGGVRPFDAVIKIDSGTPLSTTVYVTVTASLSTTPAYSATTVIEKHAVMIVDWELRQDTPMAILDHAFVATDDYLYQIGGAVDGTSGGVTNTFRYDPASDSWIEVTGMITGVYIIDGDNVTDTIYILGGYTGAVADDNVQIYDASADSWTSGAVAPRSRAAYAAAELGGIIFRIGGGDVSAWGSTNDVDLYNPTADAWNNPANPADYLWQVRWPCAGEINGQIYVAGGLDNADAEISNAAVYNPTADSWSDAAMADAPATFWGVTDFVKDGRLVCAGGIQGGSASALVWVYDPATNSWSQAPDLNDARFRLEGDFLDEGYALGGHNPVWTPHDTLERTVQCQDCDCRLELEKEGPPWVYQDDVATYLIRLVNTGELSATAILTDELPSGVAYAGNLACDGLTCWYDSGDDAVYFDDEIPPYEAITVTFDFTATAPISTWVVNTATVEYCGGFLEDVHEFHVHRPPAFTWTKQIAINGGAWQDYTAGPFDVMLGDTVEVSETLAYTGTFPHFAYVFENWAGYPLEFQDEYHTAGAMAHGPDWFDWGVTLLPGGSETLRKTLLVTDTGWITITERLQPDDVEPYTRTIGLQSSRPEPDWEKSVWVSGAPFTGTVYSGLLMTDDIQIVDRVWVTSTNPVTFSLVEEWSDSLELTPTHVVSTGGSLTWGTGVVTWDVAGGAANTWHVITKTFEVVSGTWTVDHITETLWVEDADPQPGDVELEFWHAGVCVPVSIDDLQSSSPVTLGQAMYFTATVSGDTPITYTWDFGDGSPVQSGVGLSATSYLYSAANTYTVTLDVENGCPSTDTDYIVVTVNAYYTLTVAQDGTGSGTVTPTVGTHVYISGTTVWLTATATAGSTFAGWSGAATGATNPVSITMDSDKTITATFDLLTYTLTVATDGAGSGTTDPSVGQHVYDYGTTVWLTATADTGSSFAGWSGAATGAANPVSVTMDSDKAITVTFDLLTYTLTVATDTPDTGSGTVTPTVGTHVYDYGAMVWLTATADPGSTFLGWEGAAVGLVNPVSVTITGDATITATFTTQQAYTLTVATDGTGTGTVDPPVGSHGYISGTTVWLTATADTGSTFAGWSGAATGATNPVSVTMDGDKAITATFDLLTYTLTVATGGAGSGTVTPAVGTHVYDYGDTVWLTATADTGSTFAGWSGAATGATNPVSVTMTSDKAITATFDLLTYTLTVATGGAGSGTVTPSVGTHVYDYGDTVWLTATADTGSTFAGWSGAATGATNPVSVTMDGDKVITATFDLLTYTLTVATDGTGTGTVTPSVGSHSYVSGTTVWLTATADTGSTFAGWSGAASGPTNPISVTMDGDKVVTATFTAVCTQVTGVNLSLVTGGTIYTDTNVEFSADVAPDNAAKPYTYTVDYGDGTAPVTATSSDDPLETPLDHTFAFTGAFTVEIEVWNCTMTNPVTDSLEVTVSEYGVCVDLSSIAIAGATTGYPGVYTFTTSYQPSNASLPISYTWDDGGATSITVRSLTVGAHEMVVTATNCTAALVTDTHTIVISAAPVCTEVTNVDLTLLTGGTIYTDTNVQFSADVAPDDATKPYTYTIDYGDGISVTATSSSDPLVLNHTFAATGTYDVEIAVWNCDMTEPVTNAVQVIVSEYGVCVDLTSITIAGDTSGASGVYTFTTSYLPPNATSPIAYLWDNGDTTSTTVRSLGVGTATLVVTATNCTAAMVTDTHEIVITAHIYLPLVMRNYP